MIISHNITEWDWLGCGLQGFFGLMVVQGTRELLENNQIKEIKPQMDDSSLAAIDDNSVGHVAELQQGPP